MFNHSCSCPVYGMDIVGLKNNLDLEGMQILSPLHLLLNPISQGMSRVLKLVAHNLLVSLTNPLFDDDNSSVCKFNDNAY